MATVYLFTSYVIMSEDGTHKEDKDQAFKDEDTRTTFKALQFAP